MDVSDTHTFEAGGYKFSYQSAAQYTVIDRIREPGDNSPTPPDIFDQLTIKRWNPLPFTREQVQYLVRRYIEQPDSAPTSFSIESVVRRNGWLAADPAVPNLP